MKHFECEHPAGVILRLDGDWESEEQAKEYAKEICYGYAGDIIKNVNKQQPFMWDVK